MREVFAQVLSDLRIPYTRVPVEPGLRSCTWLPEHLQRFYMQVEKDALDSMPVFTRYGIRSVCGLLCVFALFGFKCIYLIRCGTVLYCTQWGFSVRAGLIGS